MNSTLHRQALMPLIQEACNDGTCLAKACLQIGLSARTVQRWQRTVVRPANQLSDAERQAALEMLNSDEFKDLPPSQIVPA